MKKNVLLSVLILIYSISFAQDFQWAKNFGNINSIGSGISIKADKDGNIYTTGGFRNNIDFDPGQDTLELISNGDWDIFLTKLDSVGNLIWAKSFGGASTDSGMFLTLDSLGNIYVTGFFAGTSDFDPHPLNTYTLTASTFYDTFILKLDKNGNLIWAKNTSSSSSACVGYTILLDKNLNLFVTGSFSGTTDFNPNQIGLDTLKSAGGYDAFMLKLDSLGNYQWVKNIGRSTGNEIAYESEIDTQGNIYTVGHFNSTSDFNPGAGVNNLSTSGNTDIFISKLDNNGDFIWAKKLGGNGLDEGDALVLDDQKNIYLTGFFEGTADFNPHISISHTLNATYGLNAFISKLDSSGNFVWAKNIGRNQSNNVSRSIKIDNKKHLYIGGYFMHETDFNPGADSFYLYSPPVPAMNNYSYILQLDSLGNFINAQSLGEGCNDAFCYSINLDNSGNILATGNFSGTGDFDPGNNTFNLNASSSLDIFILKLKSSLITDTRNIIDKKEIGVNIYPNPNNGSFTIKSKENINLNLINNIARSFKLYN